MRQVLPLVEELDDKHETLCARAEELAADKAFDSGDIGGARR